MEDRPATSLWASFQQDPRDRAVISLRAGDAHRDLVAGEVRRPERKQSRALESQQAKRSDP